MVDAVWVGLRKMVRVFLRVKVKGANITLDRDSRLH